jgi:hypothetical protein
MCSSIAGDSAAVSGTTRGIGMGTTLVFAHDGARVHALVKNGETSGETAKLSGSGGFCLCVNAGIFADCRLGDMADGDMDQVVDTKLNDGIFLGYRAVPDAG